MIHHSSRKGTRKRNIFSRKFDSVLLEDRKRRKEENKTMTDKADLKVIDNKPLTIKQQNFINEIVKGKVTSNKEAYCKAYEVTMNKDGTIPKWVEVEASKLLADPKLSQSLQSALAKKEDRLLASSLRVKSYVLDRLYRESQEASNDSARIRSLELLGKSVSMFSDVVETKKERTPEEIEREIQEKIRLLSDSS